MDTNQPVQKDSKNGEKKYKSVFLWIASALLTYWFLNGIISWAPHNNSEDDRKLLIWNNIIIIILFFGTTRLFLSLFKSQKIGYFFTKLIFVIVLLAPIFLLTVCSSMNSGGWKGG
jgi:hypothetical protein